MQVWANKANYRNRHIHLLSSEFGFSEFITCRVARNSPEVNGTHRKI